MKKIFAILLTATMLCALFVLPSAAADDINFAASVPFIENAPAIDGVVNIGEYSTVKAQHSYSANPEQFSQQDDHDEYDNWDVEFYSAWDADNLYFAWVVKSEIHKGLEKGTYDGYTKVSDEWPEVNPYGPMWWHSCIQFMLTPGAPGGSTSYANNYLEVGLCLLADGEIGRVAWTLPKGVNEDEISLNVWDAAIVRDEAAGTTTYEVAIPKMMTGLYAFGTDAQFGFTYAAAAQENYGTKKGMLEWQDCNLGSKNPDKAAVMTLSGGDVAIEKPNEVVEGELPEEAKGEGVVQVLIDNVNTNIQGEDAVLITDTSMNWNGSWSYNMLLKPIEGDNAYEVLEVLDPTGVDPVFFNEVTDEMVILAVHSMNEEGCTGIERYAAAYSIREGSKVVLFGIDVENGKLAYTNAMLYTTELVTNLPEDDTSDTSDVSDETSEQSKPSVSKPDTSKPETSNNDKNNNSFNPDSEKNDEGGFFNTLLALGVWAIILIIALPIILIVAIVVIIIVIIKKKKK